MIETFLIAEWQNILFYLGIVFMFVMLARWHNSGDNQFDFRLALIEPKSKRISFSRLGHFVSLIVSTSIVCYETTNGRLSEWLFAGYMVTWAGTYVATKAINKGNVPTDSSQNNDQ